MQNRWAFCHFPCHLFGIFPWQAGADAFLGGFFLDGAKVVCHLGYIDAIAVLKSYMIKIHLSVVVKQYVGVNSLARCLNHLLVGLTEWSQWRWGCGYSNLLIGCIEHIVGVASFGYLWRPKTCGSERSVAREAKAVFLANRSRPFLEILRLIDIEAFVGLSSCAI